MRQAKLPNGVFTEIYGNGETGDYLIDQDIDLIHFTGSTKVGQNLYRKASGKFIKAILELGGSAPGIVFDDADLQQVVDGVYANRFFNSGQACDGLKRLIVQKSRFQEVTDALAKSLQLKKVDDPSNPETDIGPVVSERQFTVLTSQVKDAIQNGAKIVCGGKRIKDLPGYFYEPTILTNIKKSMRVWREEVFGPVLPIVAFEIEEEAIDLANDTKHGLGGYIFTQDHKKASRVASKLQTGMVSVNNSSYLYAYNPFGGYKMSGLGREHGKWGLRELCQVKVVTMNK